MWKPAMPSSMVMEKNAMPNDMAKRGVAIGSEHRSQPPFSFPSSPRRGRRRGVFRRERPDRGDQDVVHQVAGRLGFVQAFQPVHAGRRLLHHARQEAQTCWCASKAAS